MFQNWIKCLLLKYAGSALKSSATQVRVLIITLEINLSSISKFIIVFIVTSCNIKLEASKPLGRI